MNDPTVFPIRIELQGMKHTLHTAFMEHLGKMDDIVKAEIDRVCTPENIARIVADTADHEIKRAIQDQIERFYRFGAGREAVMAVVKKTLEERTGHAG